MRSVKIRGVSLRLELLRSDSKGLVALTYLLPLTLLLPPCPLLTRAHALHDIRLIYGLAGERLLRTSRSQVTLYAT